MTSTQETDDGLWFSSWVDVSSSVDLSSSFTQETDDGLWFSSWVDVSSSVDLSSSCTQETDDGLWFSSWVGVSSSVDLSSSSSTQHRKVWIGGCLYSSLRQESFPYWQINRPQTLLCPELSCPGFVVTRLCPGLVFTILTQVQNHEYRNRYRKQINFST